MWYFWFVFVFWLFDHSGDTQGLLQTLSSGSLLVGSKKHSMSQGLNTWSGNSRKVTSMLTLSLCPIFQCFYQHFFLRIDGLCRVDNSNIVFNNIQSCSFRFSLLFVKNIFSYNIYLLPWEHYSLLSLYSTEL